MKQLYTHLKVALTFVVLLASLNSFSQNVGINATGVAPAASAGLDVNFSNKGVLIPNVALTGTTDVSTITSPANSLLVYNTATASSGLTKVTPGYYYYSTSLASWVRVNSEFKFSDSNLYYTGGNLGLGTTSPANLLSIRATNPLALHGVQAGTASDSLLTLQGGQVKMVSPTTFTTTLSSVWNLAGNAAIGASQFLGTTDAQPLRIRTNNVQRMLVTSAGNVGIGASNPSYALAVNSPNPLALYQVQTGTITDSILTISSGVVKKLHPQISSQWSVKGNTSTDSATYFIGTTDAKPLKFKTAATQRMIIKENGRFGLGTTLTDSAFITVNAGTVAANNTGFPTLMSLEGSRSGYLQFNVQNNDGGVKASTDIVATANNGTEEASYIDMGINSGGYSSGGNALLNGANTAYLYANGGKMFIGNAASNEPLIFFTNSGSASDEDANGAERMRILSSGEVAIGTTSVTSGVKLEVNGNIKATNVTYSSDKRLKKNIESLNYGLTDILKFKPVTYNWIDAQQGNEKQIGLIAQEARSIIPEVVLGDEQKEKLSVNYTQLIPVLINAIKEQQKQIEDLKKVVADLQKK